MRIKKTLTRNPGHLQRERCQRTRSPYPTWAPNRKLLWDSYMHDKHHEKWIKNNLEYPDDICKQTYYMTCMKLYNYFSIPTTQFFLSQDFSKSFKQRTSAWEKTMKNKWKVGNAFRSSSPSACSSTLTCWSRSSHSSGLGELKIDSILIILHHSIVNLMNCSKSATGSTSVRILTITGFGTKSCMAIHTVRGHVSLAKTTRLSNHQTPKGSKKLPNYFKE